MSYIKEQRTEVREATVGVKCDVCGKTQPSEGGETPKGWMHFTHGHQGWGNDSIDSIQYFDVCSVPCYRTQIERSLRLCGDNYGFKVNDMDADFAKALLAAFA